MQQLQRVHPSRSLAVRASLPFLAAGAALLLAPRVDAQRAISWGCGSNTQGLASEFGRAVSLTGQAGGLVVGAPGANALSGCYCEPVGAVYLPGGVQVEGLDVDDRFGLAVLGGLDLDGDAVPDALGGAPGDDDVADGCGSLAAISGADGSVLYRVFGAGAGDGLGGAFAKVGDLDGDGRDDFLVGAAQRASGGPGYVHLVSGSDGSILRTHAGMAAGDALGTALVGLGDIDADGAPDYAIGAPGASVGGAACGRVHLFSGADGSTLLAWDGADAGEQFGFALASTTDVDRDGVDEVLVGAPRSGVGTGSVHVFSGATRARLTQIDGEHDGDWFGAAVAGAGDFDGDGHGDVAVGAPAGDPFAPVWATSGAGAATVFSGSDGSVLARLGGGGGGAGVGVALAGGQDVDGDGLADVLVGGRIANDGYGDSSCVVFLGRPRGARVEAGPAGFTGYGTSVAGVGDLGGDGLGDVLVGAPDAVDDQGDARGLARVLSPRDGTMLFEFRGDAPGDRLGQAVACAGDVDGDGVQDLLVGSARSRTGYGVGNRPGYAKLYSGATGAELHHLAGSGDPGFGGALAGGADVDGDGFDDVIVGGAGITLQGPGASLTELGEARVFSGQTGEELYAFVGSTYGDALGFSVALLDDLDGDGHAEFLFGVPGRYVDAPWFTLGEVELHSGSDGSLVHTFHAYDLRLGMAACVLDDLDGDGLRDLALSTWDPGQLWSAGSVWVYSSGDFRSLWNVYDAVPYSGPSFGYALAPAGDVDGDGTADLAVGVPGTIQAYAASIGRAVVLSGDSGALLRSHSGYSGWDYFGYSVAGLGDANGDGLPDLAIGAPTDPRNASGAEPGRNRVHFALTNHLEQYNHCRSNANSSGSPATLSAAGLGSVALNQLTLTARGVPAGRSGVFFFGSSALQQPFGDGFRCVGGAVRRLPGPARAAVGGTLVRDIDLARAPADRILSGSSWSFQLWFRDSGPSGFDLSDAVRLTFGP